MRQMLLDLAVLPTFDERTWLVTGGNRAAHEAVRSGLPCVCLYGPPGGGKSHLLAYAAAHGAVVGDELELLDVAGQERLFHALNAKVPVVVASRAPVAQVEGLLPDLQSRLLLGIQLEVAPPDDDELRALLARWAEVRQLALPEAVVDYMLARAGRSTHELVNLVGRLDALSLEQKRAITVPLARAVLG
jgi:DnaA family protein